MSEEENISQQNSNEENVNENISQQPIIEQPENKNMEVHHHPDLHHKKKNFKEYFLEFLMIFLAVTLGFFAESYREYHVEKENTERFLQAYRDELLQQQHLFISYKKKYQNKVVVCDSMKNIFYNHKENRQLKTVDNLLMSAMQIIEMSVNTSSYDQMVNAGALRYIHDIQLRDSMASYRGQIESFKDYNAHILQSIINNTFEVSKLEDLNDIVSSDTTETYKMYNHLPRIKPFASLSDEQRNFLVFFYEGYVVQAQSDLVAIRRLYASNKSVVKMIEDQVDKQ